MLKGGTLVYAGGTVTGAVVSSGGGENVASGPLTVVVVELKA